MAAACVGPVLARLALSLSLGQQAHVTHRTVFPTPGPRYGSELLRLICSFSVNGFCGTSICIDATAAQALLRPIHVSYANGLAWNQPSDLAIEEPKTATQTSPGPSKYSLLPFGMVC